MSRSLAFLPFVLLTVVTWGNYGVLMHHGSQAMGGDAVRPFIGVGFAYFVIAVLVPLWILSVKGEKGAWSRDGIILSLVAGAVGALGALGVIVAFSAGAKPVYVMPLVFGGAPVINTLVTMAMSTGLDRVRPVFILGILMAALGGAGVLYFRPSPTPAVKPVTVMQPGTSAEVPKVVTAPAADLNFPLIIAAIVGGVVSWGSYGPVLHKGQMKMGGSRLRPFLCVGIAYFVMALAVSLLLVTVLPAKGQWDTHGVLWSLGGGTAGALGALGIIYAFNFGGKPIFVMPLVFGLAPILNTITTLTENKSWGHIDLYFIAALLITICGAITVLVTAPKPSAKPAPVTGPQPTAS